MASSMRLLEAINATDAPYLNLLSNEEPVIEFSMNRMAKSYTMDHLITLLDPVDGSTAQQGALKIYMVQHAPAIELLEGSLHRELISGATGLLMDVFSHQDTRDDILANFAIKRGGTNTLLVHFLICHLPSPTRQSKVSSSAALPHSVVSVVTIGLPSKSSAEAGMVLKWFATSNQKIVENKSARWAQHKLGTFLLIVAQEAVVQAGYGHAMYAQVDPDPENHAIYFYKSRFFVMLPDYSLKSFDHESVVPAVIRKLLSVESTLMLVYLPARLHSILFPYAMETKSCLTYSNILLHRAKLMANSLDEGGLESWKRGMNHFPFFQAVMNEGGTSVKECLSRDMSITDSPDCKPHGVECKKGSGTGGDGAIEGSGATVDLFLEGLAKDDVSSTQFPHVVCDDKGTGFVQGEQSCLFVSFSQVFLGNFQLYHHLKQAAAHVLHCLRCCDAPPHDLVEWIHALLSSEYHDGSHIPSGSVKNPFDRASSDHLAFDKDWVGDKENWRYFLSYHLRYLLYGLIPAGQLEQQLLVSLLGVRIDFFQVRLTRKEQDRAEGSNISIWTGYLNTGMVPQGPLNAFVSSDPAGQGSRGPCPRYMLVHTGAIHYEVPVFATDRKVGEARKSTKQVEQNNETHPFEEIADSFSLAAVGPAPEWLYGTTKLKQVDGLTLRRLNGMGPSDHLTERALERGALDNAESDARDLVEHHKLVREKLRRVRSLNGNVARLRPNISESASDFQDRKKRLCECYEDVLAKAKTWETAMKDTSRKTPEALAYQNGEFHLLAKHLDEKGGVRALMERREPSAEPTARAGRVIRQVSTKWVKANFKQAYIQFVKKTGEDIVEYPTSCPAGDVMARCTAKDRSSTGKVPSSDEHKVARIVWRQSSRGDQTGRWSIHQHDRNPKAHPDDLLIDIPVEPETVRWLLGTPNHKGRWDNMQASLQQVLSGQACAGAKQDADGKWRLRFEDLDDLSYSFSDSQITQLRYKGNGQWAGLSKVFPVGWIGNPQTKYEPLQSSWVLDNFAEGFLQEVVALSHDNNRFVKVPPGRSRMAIARPGEHVPQANQTPGVHYPQGERQTCVSDSLASALHYMGHVALADTIHSVGGWAEHSSGGRGLLEAVRKGMEINMPSWQIKRIDKEDVLAFKGDVSFPRLLILFGRDGGTTHAVTTVDGWIFDSNTSKAMPLTQDSLNECCGAAFYGIVRGYHFSPQDGQKQNKKRRREKSAG